MTSYVATIRHHSISRARFIECGSDLTAAKKLAAREFRDAPRDYVITIYAHDFGYPPEIRSTRRVGGRKWEHLPL
jgi:hypothetical protein